MKSTKLVTYFLFLLAIGMMGQLQAQPFVRLYGGAGDEPAGFGSGYDGAPAVSLAADNQGNYYLCTYTNSNNTGFVPTTRGDEDIWVIKLNASGDTLWSKTYGGAGNERAFQIKYFSDNTLVMAGRTASSSGTFTQNKGQFDGFLLKINTDGEVIWARTYGGSLIDAFFGLKESNNGQIIAFGQTGSIDGDINQTSHAGSQEAWVIKTDASGQITWQVLSSGIVDDPDWLEGFWDGVELSNGFTLLMGYTGNFMDFNTDDILLVWIDPVGTLDYKSAIGSSTMDAPAGLVSHSDGTISIAFRCGGSVGGFAGHKGSGDVCVVKINEMSDSLLWVKYLGGTGMEYPYGISTNAANEIFISAVTRSVDGDASWNLYADFDAWWLQLDAQGDTMRTRRLGGSSVDFAHAFVAVDNTGGYLAGRTRSNDGLMLDNQGGVDVFFSRIDYNNILTHTQAIEAQPWSFELFPNPGSEWVHLRNSASTNGFVEVLDIAGRVVLREQMQQQTHSLYTSHLQNGIYWIRLRQANGVSVRPWVKQ